MRVSDLVDRLSERLPFDWAEAWDRPGLSVGNPSEEVRGVACALDVTRETIAAACEQGCNVLLTHHPVFLDPPATVTPDPIRSGLAGACVWDAARLGVSLVAFHTNLDKSDDALDLAAGLLGLRRMGRLQEPDGYGAVLDAGTLTVGDLADRCAGTFAGTPIVWGSRDAIPGLVSFCSGSLGSLGELAPARGVGCVVSGEAGYHRLEDLLSRGVGAILLGHDASELPFAGLLARIAREEAPDIRIVTLDEQLRWHAWAAGE